MVNQQSTINNQQLLHWKALYVASRSEKKVNATLKELGLESYLPLKTEKKQWSDRIKNVVTPLINGYVFVKTNEQNRDLVFKVPHVIQYVRSNAKDAIIRDSEIEILKSVEAKGYHIDGKFGIDFKIGNDAMIMAGPFKGYLGLIINNNNKAFLKIAIKSIDFQLTVSLPSEVLSEV